MMHPDYNNATVEDLWPGDIIIARRPGGYTGMPYRFVDARQGNGNLVMVRIVSLDGEKEYEVPAFEGWGERVERVV